MRQLAQINTRNTRPCIVRSDQSIPSNIASLSCKSLPPPYLPSPPQRKPSSLPFDISYLETDFGDLTFFQSSARCRHIYQLIGRISRRLYSNLHWPPSFCIVVALFHTSFGSFHLFSYTPFRGLFCRSEGPSLQANVLTLFTTYYHEMLRLGTPKIEIPAI